MNILDSFKKLFFYRQHPDAALRYLPIVDLLKKEGLEDSKILEVGSGSYGITPYLGKKVVGVDTDFSEPEYSLLVQVKSSAVNLPFKDNEFDVVIFSDMLEHLNKLQRIDALNEGIRVAKKEIVISGPFGDDAKRQDQELAEYSLKKTGKMHPYFKDHLKLGLPDSNEVREEIRANKKVKEVRVIGNYLNLNVRKLLMKFFISNNKLMFYFYLKGLMPLVPLLRNFNGSPCYRTLLEVRLGE